ncbi:hypothetical protein [Streptomyces tendae]|uniref:hypothetical protein n=1 Tax=Streptomyces tendae TaxID=1932 RepID=UPI00372402AE
MTTVPSPNSSQVEADGTTYETAEQCIALFDKDGSAFMTFLSRGEEVRSIAVPRPAAEDLGAALTQGTATALNRLDTQPATSFEDIVEADAGLSPMYRAVVQVEQQEPDQLPIVIGMKAWALLDPEQQRESFKDLLHAYVDVVQHQRDGRPIR